MRTYGKYIFMTKKELEELKSVLYTHAFNDKRAQNPVCSTNCKTKACVNARPKPIRVKVIKDTVL